jgi:hypothetical protein
MTSILKLFALLFAVLLPAVQAQAATLSPGDNVTVQYLNDGTVRRTNTGTISAIGGGADTSLYTVLQIDLNSGAAGDGFNITVAGNYCGFSCDGSDITMLFTGLDFGSTYAIDNFVNNTSYAVTANVINSSSFSLTWSENLGFGTYLPAGVLFSGTFGPVPSTVPLPAGLNLLLSALGLLGWHKARKVRA